MAFGDKLKKYRKMAGITQEALGNALGVGKSTVSEWEKNKRTPDIDRLVSIAEAINTSPQLLLDDAGIPVGFEPLPKMKKVPLLGTIACGEPLMSLEDATYFYDVTESIHADFCLRCKGDSMINARILNGDIVFIHSQPDVENGEIAAVEIDGEATLKRVHKFCVGGHLRMLELRAENPNEPIRTYEGEQLQSVRIIGKAVAFTSHVR